MTKIVSLFIVSAVLFSCGMRDKSSTPVSSEASETRTATAEMGEIEYEIIDEGLESTEYAATETVFTDLIHTKLQVNFDWATSRMNGIATITAKPHFYASDSIVLDAKGMDILAVTMSGKDLNYVYTNDLLRIKLGKEYTRKEKFTIEIKYLAKPDERTIEGSAAITSDKGLFFINPLGKDENKMPQIWTQGETEASSVWFPTIDAPNVKTTQEIFITVEDKYTTLSNGKMISSKKNTDGTRTDHWKQELPHAPYLFMMGVGEFSIVKDSYKRQNGSVMEVNYYVEKEWEQYAKDIFGETPNMIAYFSELLGVEYPWDKYHQIVVRDYVSGAMENTGAVVFGDYAYKNKRELLDANDQSTIAHELFHHWFGDLVTAESWSNLTLNESFANYSQYLWDEFKYGQDEADYQSIQEEDGYYQSASMGGYHELAWFHYGNKEEMFDGHSYNKGGRILHMLRNYIGDDAFFTSLSLYLNDNKYKAAEYHQLRLAFEEVTGEDLNWFFKQWYEAKGHPVLDVDQKINETDKKVTLFVSQKQDVDKFTVFRLPVDVAIYDSEGKHIHRVWVDNLEDTIVLPYSGTVHSVVFDNDKMLLAKVNETKPVGQLIHQYYKSDRYETRLQSLQDGVEKGNPLSEQLVLDALNDPFWNIRSEAIQKVAKLSDEKQLIAQKIIKNLFVSDPKSAVRSSAATYLTKYSKDADVVTMLESAIAKDQSYMVVGNSLKQLGKLDSDKALLSAKSLENEESSKILASVAQVYSSFGEESDAPFFEDLLMNKQLGIYDQLSTMNAFTLFNSRMSLDQIEGSVKVYEHLNENGGYYTKMFTGQSLEYLKQTLDQRKENLLEEKANEEDVLKLGEIQAKLAKINVLTIRFSKLLEEKE